MCLYLPQLSSFTSVVVSKLHPAKYVIDNMTTRFVLIFKVSDLGSYIVYHFREGNKSYKSVWDHFRGMNKAVCAKPYLRFRCTGDDFSKTTKTDTVTVTEVFTEQYTLPVLNKISHSYNIKNTCSI